MKHAVDKVNDLALVGKVLNDVSFCCTTFEYKPLWVQLMEGVENAEVHRLMEFFESIGAM
jgi:hypothetical protein